MLITSACGDAEAPIAVPLPATDTALCVALGADYQSLGTIAVIGLPSLTVIKDMVPNAISKDPVLRLIGRRLYVVNRSANNVTVIDPTTRPWRVEAQFSTGAGTNPQDIAQYEYVTYVWQYTFEVKSGSSVTFSLGAKGANTNQMNTTVTVIG
jgi:YVTN family beta-propeller protein